VGTIRVIWALQDKLALTPEEEKAIELKHDLVAGQERVAWNPARSLPPKEFDFADVEIARSRSALKTWNAYGASADRGWLEPLLEALCAR
jgi:hypothetical protein